MAPARKPPSKDKDPEMVLLGKRLRELRLERELTQERLADAAGLHWTYIGQIERGERNLTAKNVLRLERGLDLRPGTWFATTFGDVSLPSTD
ncbi:MAG TPA: helix-turn-helix transcriptional regulator [Acidimicrobiales bacterium]|jgi:transcriptional regulator with XRE-family HTH domain|nr:helix-turn-helix transcriptional regulator [Acidimicrobiales bacterium]